MTVAELEELMHLRLASRSSTALALLLASSLAPLAHAQEVAEVPAQEAGDPTPLEASTPPPPVAAHHHDAPPPETCIGRVHPHVERALLRVESGLRVGAGFLAIDTSHAVTSRALVADGHDVRVVDAEGDARNARVIATAPDDDLALLELAAPLDGEPLAVATWDDVAVGHEVVVASFALGGASHHRQRHIELGFALASGAVNARGDRVVQVDARPASSGSPIVGCDGRVVGVVSTRWLDDGAFTMGAGAGALADLVGRADRPEGHGGRVRFVLAGGLSSAFEDQPPEREPDMLMGGYLQLGMTAFDAFALAARVHLMTASTEPVGTADLRRSTDRVRIDAYAAWRQLLVFGPGMGMHFELGLGASATHIRDSARRLEIDATGPRFIDVASERWRVRPMAILNVQLGFVVIGYALEIELEDRSGHAYHLATLGLSF